MRNEEQMKTPGQIAFEVYNEAKGGKTYDGKPIPPWDTLTDETGRAVQAAWEKAAVAVAQSLLQHLDNNPVESIARTRRAVAEIVPKGREQALALTKLDEAMMWLVNVPVQAPALAEPAAPG